MTQERILDLADVFKSYHPEAGPLAVLKGLSLTAGPGESLAVTGPSGSGKSTLIHLLAGIDVVDEGRILVAGTDLSTCEEEALDRFRSLQVGIVFQEHQLLPQCTALENVLLPTLPLDVDRQASADRARELLHGVQLADRGDHYPAQLSGGECQRVALARALINRPRVLLADEPTGSLDGETGLRICELMRSMVDEGMTLVTVTHDEEVARLMDRRFRLYHGRLEEETASR